MVENRKAQLAEQVADTHAKIAALEAEMGVLDGRQAQIMQVLAGKGALDDFTRMGEELATLEMQATLLREKLRNAEILEGKKNQAQIERLTSTSGSRLTTGNARTSSVPPCGARSAALSRSLSTSGHPFRSL